MYLLKGPQQEILYCKECRCKNTAIRPNVWDKKSCFDDELGILLSLRRCRKYVACNIDDKCDILLRHYDTMS